MKMVVSITLRSTHWPLQEASIFAPYWLKLAAKNWLIHFMQSAVTQVHRKLIEQVNALCKSNSLLDWSTRYECNVLFSSSSYNFLLQ